MLITIFLAVLYSLSNFASNYLTDIYFLQFSKRNARAMCEIKQMFHRKSYLMLVRHIGSI